MTQQLTNCLELAAVQVNDFVCLTDLIFQWLSDFFSTAVNLTVLTTHWWSDFLTGSCCFFVSLTH